MALARKSRRNAAGRQRDQAPSDARAASGERVGPESVVTEGAAAQVRSVQRRSSPANTPLLTLQQASGNRALRELLDLPAQRIARSVSTISKRQDPAADRKSANSRESVWPSGALVSLQRAVGNQAVQRLVSRSTAVAQTVAEAADEARQPTGGSTPKAGVVTDLNTPAGGAAEKTRDAQGFEDRCHASGVGRQAIPDGARMGWTTSSGVGAAQSGSLLRQTDGPMGSPRSAPTVLEIQRKVGDGHDLKSARLKGDPILEAVFDNERVLRTGSSGAAVIKVQHALTDLGLRMPQHGIDGDFGAETRSQVKTFQKSAGLTDDGVVGPKTMEALDNQLDSGAGGPGPLPSPVPAPPGKAAPTLAAVINTGPTPGIDGQMNFVINWQLGSNAAPKGGFVIQDVLFVWRSRDRKGKDVPNPDPRTSPLRYFEAWRVAPNSKTLTPVTTDTFFWPGNAPWAGNNSKGRVTIAATARYFDDIDTLPKHMVANNAATFAGILQSSLADPALVAAPSGPVAHSLAFHWDSTTTPNSPTVLDAHTP